MTGELTPQDIAAHFAPMASLYKKKAKVMELLKPVQKNGRTDKFAYMTASDIKQSVQQAMAEVNLSLSISLTGYEIEATDKGRRTTAKFTITLCDGDSGASETSEWIGVGSDFGNDDKGFNKASTSALKYFLAATFLVSSAEENDSSKSSRNQVSQPTRPSRDTAPSAPAAPLNQTAPRMSSGDAIAAVLSDYMGFMVKGAEFNAMRDDLRSSVAAKKVNVSTPEQARAYIERTYAKVLDLDAMRAAAKDADEMPA